MPLVPRALRSQLDASLADTRVTAILGPRQSGKSTLAQEAFESGAFATYVTLDTQATREAALRDPDGFIAGLARPAVIDEIQRAPETLLAIKAVVDRDQTPGQFLLTGSSNLLVQRGVVDALPGRVEYLRLWPFSQSELHGEPSTIIDRLLANDPPRLSEQPVGMAAYADTIVRGGFPAAYGRDDRRRAAYFASYVTSMLHRDIEDIAAPQVEPASVAKLLRVLATRSSNLANFEGLGRDLKTAGRTAQARTDLLEQLFLVHQLRPWSANLSSREIKTPKIFLTDSGLLCSLIGATADRLVHDPDLAGKALETFVFTEVLRQSEWADAMPSGLHFYRDQRQREVDVVVEMADGRIVALETKTAARITARDTRGLRYLRDHLGDRFAGGCVLYTGAATLALEDRIWAVPLSALWDPGP